MSGRSRDSGRDSRGGNGKGSFNFPQWNYGYTIGPASQATAGDYSQFFVAQPGQATILGGPPRGGGGAPRGSPMRGGSGRSGGQVNLSPKVFQIHMHFIALHTTISCYRSVKFRMKL